MHSVTIERNYSEIRFDLSTSGDVYVIGSGPSIVDFDVNKLSGVKIGANFSAIEYQTDFLVSIDQNFISQNDAAIRKYVSSGGTAILAGPHGKRSKIDGVYYLRKGRSPYLSNDPTVLNGPHSGFAALNFAFLSGARKINLLGFDLTHSADRTHMHDNYTAVRSDAQKSMARWASNMDLAANQLKEEDVDVINWTGDPDSLIRVFTKKSLEKLL